MAFAVHQSLHALRNIQYGHFIMQQCFASNLLRDKCLINGKWVSATDGKTFNVKNPSNDKVISSVPDMNDKDTSTAIDAAHEAFKTWQFTTAKERGTLLKKWYDLTVKHQDELAKIMTAEQGKPLKEALGEVVYGSSFLEWFGEEARRVYGEVAQSPTTSKEMIFIRRPIGVVGLITPWNFPNAMITRKAGAALAAGCTCIIKPAEDTPLSALALVALADEAGFPPGTINVITSDEGNTPAVGKLLCESPLVSGISFTGSTEVGKILYRQCADGIKRISLELGGNAPFIVFDSANINLAVEGAIASKFRNAGQTCVSANRFFVQKNVFDQFVEKLREHAETKLVVGDGFDDKVNQGPLINKIQAQRVDNLVQNAVNNGATVILGGKPHTMGDKFYQPTILTKVTPKMNCYNEEIFGPVAIVIPFDTEEEGLAMANDTQRGLAGYFFSNDIAQIWRVAKRLEVGMVGINEGIISSAEGAFGGVKQSGIGREGSKHGIDEYTYVKYLCFGNLQI